MQREVPATRPHGLGFIDFVAKGTAGDIRLIETKVGPDPLIVLQAVDYWAWACGVRSRLAQELDMSGEPLLAVDIVVAPDKDGKTLDKHAVQSRKRWEPSVRSRIVEVHGWEEAERGGRLTVLTRRMDVAAHS